MTSTASLTYLGAGLGQGGGGGLPPPPPGPPGTTAPATNRPFKAVIFRSRDDPTPCEYCSIPLVDFELACIATAEPSKPCHPVCFSFRVCDVPRPAPNLSQEQVIQRYQAYDPLISARGALNLNGAHLVDPIILDANVPDEIVLSDVP
jgi:hypothetical protein